MKGRIKLGNVVESSLLFHRSSIIRNRVSRIVGGPR